MKKTKLYIGLLLVIAFALSFAACGGMQEAVTGTWVLSSAEMYEQTVTTAELQSVGIDTNVTLTFKNGTVTFSGNLLGDADGGTASYLFKEDTITINAADGTFTAEYSNDSIALPVDDITTLYFSKK